MAVGDGAFAEAHRELLSDASIQFDFTALTPPRTPIWLEWLKELFGFLGPYGSYLFWGLAGLGALIILVLLVRELIGASWRLPWQRRRPQAERASEAWRPEPAAARGLLAEADALAAAGEFAAAAHLLLRRSVEEIADRLPGFLRPSLTARDIAAATSLPGPARAAFSHIAGVVETSLFGLQPLGEEAWRSCRRAYERFAFPDSWA